MDFPKFLAIKGEYEHLYNSLLSKGRLPMKDTGIGFWGISVADDLYNLFSRINLEKCKNFLDLGSGDGKVVMIASLFTNSTGIEIDDELHGISKDIMKKVNVNAQLIKDDYINHDLSRFDAIFYNPDYMNHKLEHKLMKELNGRLFVYGPHYHPTSLHREMTFIANTTPVTVFSNAKKHL